MDYNTECGLAPMQQANTDSSDSFLSPAPDEYINFWNVKSESVMVTTSTSFRSMMLQ